MLLDHSSSDSFGILPISFSRIFWQIPSFFSIFQVYSHSAILRRIPSDIPFGNLSRLKKSLDERVKFQKNASMNFWRNLYKNISINWTWDSPRICGESLKQFSWPYWRKGFTTIPLRSFSRNPCRTFSKVSLSIWWKSLKESPQRGHFLKNLQSRC